MTTATETAEVTTEATWVVAKSKHSGAANGGVVRRLGLVPEGTEAWGVDVLADKNTGIWKIFTGKDAKVRAQKLVDKIVAGDLRSDLHPSSAKLVRAYNQGEQPFDIGAHRSQKVAKDESSEELSA